MILENAEVAIRDADGSVRRTGWLITCAFLVDRKRLPDKAPSDVTFFICLEDHDFSCACAHSGRHHFGANYHLLPW